MTIRNFIAITPLIILSACISAEQTTEETIKKETEVYVFDDIKKADDVKPDTITSIKETNQVEPAKVEVIENRIKDISIKYTVQLGAFTSKERADVFVKENQDKTSLRLQISFNAKNKLFVVQIPPYKTKEEADKIRDNLRKFSVFKESFTVLMEN